MQINRNLLLANKTIHLSEDIDFSKETFSSHIKSISACHVDANVTDYEDLLRVELKITAKVIGICSYSLEDVELNLKINDELEFTDQKEDTADFFYEPNAIISLDSYVLSLIISEIPLRIVKKGKTLPKAGDGYRVLSEEELLKEKANKTDLRWSKLDELDIK